VSGGSDIAQSFPNGLGARPAMRASQRWHPRSPVQARIAQIKLPEFHLSPCCRSACQLRHAKDESKHDFTSVYKGDGK